MIEQQRYLTQTTSGYVVAWSEAFAKRNDFRESTEAEIDAHFASIGKERTKDGRTRRGPYGPRRKPQEGQIEIDNAEEETGNAPTEEAGDTA